MTNPGRVFYLSPKQFAALLDLEECEREAQKLFREIIRRHGKTEARRIFLKYGRVPTARKLARMKNYALFDRYDLMRPKPNVQKLARELAKDNETLPREKRHGPTGSTNPVVLDKQIRRLIKKREAALKKGTWRGPHPES